MREQASGEGSLAVANLGTLMRGLASTCNGRANFHRSMSMQPIWAESPVFRKQIFLVNNYFALVRL
jgi:hypothetical protein